MTKTTVYCNKKHKQKAVLISRVRVPLSFGEGLGVRSHMAATCSMKMEEILMLFFGLLPVLQCPLEHTPTPLQNRGALSMRTQRVLVFAKSDNV